MRKVLLLLILVSNACLLTLAAALSAESQDTARKAVEQGELMPLSRFESIYSGWYWLVADSSAPRLRSRSLGDMDLAIERTAPVAVPTFSTQYDSTGRRLRVATQSESARAGPAGGGSELAHPA